MKEITDLKDLQHISYNIMQMFHSFCNEHNLKYSLAYGTLIGAVRHGGFIPWDDDIDIFMLRDDYNRFLELFEKYGDTNNFGVATYNSKECKVARPMAKLFDKHTFLVEEDYRCDSPYGIFIDIFPLDDLPLNEKECEKFIKKSKMLKAKIYASNLKYNKRFSLKQKIGIALYKNKNPYVLCEKFERFATKYSGIGANKVNCLMAKSRKCFNKSDFTNLKLVKFESSYFYIPENYDAILRMIYGDYMVLPPLEERAPHHLMKAYTK